MAHQWFVLCDGEERGPLSGRQLKDLAANGQLTVSDLVRRDDMKTAVKAEAIKGLFVTASESCPPLPPAVNDGQGAIPEQESSESSEKNSQGSSSTAQDPQKWFVLQNQMTYGPFDFAVLRQMNAEGRIRPSDFIRKAESETWSPATSVLRFADQSARPSTFVAAGSPEAILKAGAVGALAGVVAAVLFGGFWNLLAAGAIFGCLTEAKWTGSNRVAPYPLYPLGVVAFTVLLIGVGIGWLGKSDYSDGYDTGYALSKAAVAASAAEDTDGPAVKKWRRLNERAEAKCEKKSENQEWLRGYRDGLQAGLGKYAEP